MQTLYTVTTFDDEAINQPADNKPRQILLGHFSQTRSLLIYLTWFLTEVARYAEKDAHKKASKHLPTAEDLHVNTKLSGNELLWKMLDDPALKAEFAKEKPEAILRRSQDDSIELTKKIYHQLAGTAEYKAYIAHPSRERAEEKKILEFILNDLLLANEIFTSHIEENFSNWDDDGEMLVQLMVGYLQKPGTYDFSQMPSPDKKEFAVQLLDTVLTKSEHLQSLIVPKLKNWDAERIAQLDMIIMKMGVAEFLYFETIPPKVTINEYIDLAKDYSTPQSGQFVNGILDNIHKELVTEGKMIKVEYKKG